MAGAEGSPSIAPLQRGDLVAVALQGDPGQPRPAVVVQSDLFAEHPSVVLLPLTSALVDAPLFRLRVEPSERTGLREASQVMVDKPQSVSRLKVSAAFGRLPPEQVMEMNRALALFLGLG